MSASGRAEIRRVVDRLLDDFLRLVAERHHGAPVDGAQLQQAVHAFSGSPQLNLLLSEAHNRLLVAAEGELLRQKRGDPFQRLLAHPLAEHFSQERLSRDILYNYFAFLHLVLGDMRDAMTERCAKIVAELKGTDELDFSWDEFYDDPRSKLILWSVLARIAESFKRFDVRRDWFIGLMQHRSQSISIGPNAFVPRLPSEEQPVFGTTEFNMMFAALFGPLRDLAATDSLAFERHFGTSPAQLFGPLLRQLEESGALL
jgi:hypothetical protein